jgi:hypothetical protein
MWVLKKRQGIFKGEATAMSGERQPDEKTLVVTRKLTLGSYP